MKSTSIIAVLGLAAAAFALPATLDETPDVSGRVLCRARSSLGGFVDHQC